MRRSLLPAVLLGLVVLPGTAAAQDQHSDNMSLLKTIPYEARYGDVPNYGTDMEFAKVNGKRHAFAGSEINGLQIMDISKPERTRRVAVYDCAVSQGDVQTFKRGKRTLVTYTNDYEKTANAANSQCYQDAKAAGFAATTKNSKGVEVSKLGTLVIDVSKPTRARTVSFVEIPQGSHNMTVHPSGDFLYNSNSDLITSVAGGAPAIEVHDIRDLSAPKLVKELTFAPLPGLGTESHDITFSDDGRRAYSAALSHGVIIDTEDPANPKVISEFDDETINVWHQADPFTITREDGSERNFVLVEDEFAGAAAPGVCPTGGVHVFDVTDETLPVKVGYWNIDDFAARGPLDTCTAHVFDIHEDEQVMTIAYYMGGVRVVDLSGLADLPIGVGQGDTAIGGAMKQVGFYQTEDANTWSAKTPFIEKDGDFYLYGDDINRGFDVYRYEADAEPAADTGTFLSPAAAKTQLADTLGAVTGRKGETKLQSGDRRLVCLLPRNR